MWFADIFLDHWPWLFALPLGLAGVWYAHQSGSLKPLGNKALVSTVLPSWLGGDGIKKAEITQSDIFWSLLPAALYALHQMEEHSRGAFRRYVCDHYFTPNNEKHKDLKYSINDCPMTVWLIFMVNVIGVVVNYLASFLFDVYWRGVAFRPNLLKRTETQVDGQTVAVREEVVARHNMVPPTTGFFAGVSKTNPYASVASLAGKISMGVMLINLFVHILPWIRGNGYNPGLITAMGLFVPYCAVALKSLVDTDELFLVLPYMILSGLIQHAVILSVVWLKGNLGFIGGLAERSGAVGLLGLVGVALAIWLLKRGHTDSLRSLKMS
jgi:hypothetical protein